jgi:hypothetical protein
MPTRSWQESANRGCPADSSLTKQAQVRSHTARSRLRLRCRESNPTAQHVADCPMMPRFRHVTGTESANDSCMAARTLEGIFRSESGSACTGPVRPRGLHIWIGRGLPGASVGGAGRIYSGIRYARQCNPPARLRAEGDVRPSRRSPMVGSGSTLTMRYGHTQRTPSRD